MSDDYIGRFAQVVWMNLACSLASRDADSVTVSANAIAALPVPEGPYGQLSGNPG